MGEDDGDSNARAHDRDSERDKKAEKQPVRRRKASAKRKQAEARPKRPLSAYKDQRAIILAERAEQKSAPSKGAASMDTGKDSGPSATSGGGLFASMAKTIAKRWKSISPEELERYNEAAKHESVRYRLAVDEHNRKMVETYTREIQSKRNQQHPQTASRVPSLVGHNLSQQQTTTRSQSPLPVRMPGNLQQDTALLTSLFERQRQLQQQRLEYDAARDYAATMLQQQHQSPFIGGNPLLFGRSILADDNARLLLLAMQNSQTSMLPAGLNLLAQSDPTTLVMQVEAQRQQAAQADRIHALHSLASLSPSSIQPPAALAMAYTGTGSSLLEVLDRQRRDQQQQIESLRRQEEARNAADREDKQSNGKG